MANERGTILVTGATGRQGGAVARHLLTAGWSVRALTRDPGKRAAKELEKLGADIVKGDLSDRSSLDAPLKGCYGAYGVQNFWEHGYDGEVLQGKNLADAVRAAGIQHYVYGSVGGAERRTGIPHFDSKWQVEEYTRKLGLPLTVLRPVFYMENFDAPDFRESIGKGTLSVPLPPGGTLQMIAVDDIGAFAAIAFDRPKEYIGKAIEIAGDEPTMLHTAEAFSKVLGRQVRFVEMPIEQVRKSSEEYATMFEWFRDYGYKADIQALRSVLPGLLTLEAWLHKSGWEKLKRPRKAAVAAR